MWAFDKNKGRCVAFLYGGCGGNGNRFGGLQDCEEACKGFLKEKDHSNEQDQDNDATTTATTKNHGDHKTIAFKTKASCEKPKVNKQFLFQAVDCFIRCSVNLKIFFHLLLY